MWSSSLIVAARTSSRRRQNCYRQHVPSSSSILVREARVAWFSSRGGGSSKGDETDSNKFRRTAGSTNKTAGAFERFVARRHKEQQQQKSAKRQRPRQLSFREKILDPAAGGHLNKKHQSGIPKLAARKRKSKTAIHDSYPGREAQQVMMHEEPVDEFEAALQRERPTSTTTTTPGGMRDEDNTLRSADKQDLFRDGLMMKQDGGDVNVVYAAHRQEEEDRKFLRDSLRPEGVEFVSTTMTTTTEDEDDMDDDGYEVVKSIDTSFLTRDSQRDYDRYLEEHYFDDAAKYDSDDEEYEEFDESEFIDLDNHPNITKDEDDEGTYVLHYNPNEEGYGVEGEDDPNAEYEYDSVNVEDDNVPMVTKKRQAATRRADTPDNMDVDLEERFFHPDVFDMDDPYYGPVPDEIVNQVRPLQEEGPNLEDFLEATYQHPTKFAEVRRYNLHFESRREAKPIIPKTRKNPPLEWVQAHKKFMFVSGLPSKILEEPADYDNPVHRHAISTLIADLLEMEPEQVYPANMTSAFVGFKERYVLPEVAERLNERLETLTVMTSPITISAYDGTDYGEFTKNSPDCLVQLENVPPHMTPAKLARELFTPDSDLRLVYGQLTVDNILMTSPSSALIRLDSAHHAESAVTSEAIELRLDELGSYPIDYFHAKRELIHGGFTGPNKGNELKRFGHRLIVDGDVPSNAFFRSHAGVIHLRNLDDTVTNEDIANLLQPYCTRLRDVSGSVEWVTNMQGTRTRTAFVGFDRLGEAEAFIKAVSGRIKGLGSSPVVARLVGDKKIPGFKQREARPERTEEELLDDLNNWEKHVDPKELEELEALGINKMALDLAFRSLRFHNPTYGAMDQALRSETLVPEREAGEEFRETVREYIQTVKECVGTPENPGEIYKTLFMPGEEIDLSIFEHEKRRQARIKKRLGG